LFQNRDGNKALEGFLGIAEGSKMDREAAFLRRNDSLSRIILKRMGAVIA